MTRHGTPLRMDGLLQRLGIAVVATMASGGSAPAQQVEVFRGSTLRNTYGTGILVSATKRSSGEETLRIWTDSQTIQAATRVRMPVSPDRKPYAFNLTIGPPYSVRRTCSEFPSSPIEFEACRKTTRSKQKLEGWDAFQLDPINADIQQVGMRSKAKPTIYGRCGYAPKLKILMPCDFFFEQGGHRHELNTSAIAIRNIELFRCTALALRNAIWADAPALAQLCDKFRYIPAAL